MAIEKLNISGLLIASTTLTNYASKHFQIPEWRKAASGKFVFRHSQTDDLQIAICPHPGNPQKKSDVESVANTVTEWIKAVMREYVKKQK